MLGLVLSLLSMISPCSVCQGKGWNLEYRFLYEVHDPEVCTCTFCDGRGWNTRKKPR